MNRYLVNLYLIKNLYLKYVKNSYNNNKRIKKKPNSKVSKDSNRYFISIQMSTNHMKKYSISSVTIKIQFGSVTKLCPTLCNPMNCSTPGLPVHHQLPEFTQLSIESVMPSGHLNLCRPFLLKPPIPPSIRVFSNESTLHMRWPKYWNFSFSISPSNEHSGLVSFRMDWLDLLASKGLSRVFSNTTVQKHQFFGAQPSSQSNSHIHT